MAVGAAGPEPTFTQYVLKVHSRCDLACDHCYVYEHADQSWRTQPLTMAPATVAAAAERIAEHAARHALPRVHVVLHGGEPLLLGADGLRVVMSRLHAIIDPVTQVDLRIQSNGVQLTPEICEILLEQRAKIGISLDGDREANDRHRRFAHGAGSHPQVRRALDLLRQPRFRPAYAGLLCTIDLANDPVRVYDALVAEAPPRIEFLLPHATWDAPPPRPEGIPAPYAAWLGAIHRRWLAQGCPVPIRIFESLASTAAGGPSGTEALGLDPVDLLVVETDGTWEQADSLKTAFDGAPATGLNVFAHGVDRVAAHPGIAARRAGIAALGAQCRACPVVRQCGGGLYAHRYRTGSGFDNPSVYCADLKELILSTSPPADPAPAAPAPPAGTGPLPPGVLDEIATGHIGPTTVALLDALQGEVVEALLAEVADRAGDALPDRPWDTIVRLSGDDPRGVRAVLAHPYVRVWAAACLGAGADPRYLGNVAAAAAVATGRAAQTTALVHSGQVYLPTVGSARADPGAERVAVSIDDAGTVTIGTAVALHRGERPTEVWRPARRADAGEWTVRIEDLDPYRDCYDWPAEPYLGNPELGHWAAALASARAAITRDAPGHLPGIVAGLRAITPLRPGPTGALRAATARHAYGAIGLARTAASDLAVLLVHEYQHVKLGAVLDHLDLYDPAFRTRIPVGWRDDPRPVEAVLQGTYAHLAVAEIWRSRPGAGARTRYETYRRWTADAITALLRSGALTAVGHRFVQQIGQALPESLP